jgi:hypothetical protein
MLINYENSFIFCASSYCYAFFLEKNVRYQTNMHLQGTQANKTGDASAEIGLIQV